MKMKKIFASLLSITLAIAACIQPMPAAAASETASLTLADLGMTQDMLLHGPYDSRVLRFDLPATWVLQPGGELELEITAFYVGNTAGIPNNYLGAVLDVTFNTHLQQSIPLVSGEKMIYHVPIGTDSLISPYDDGSHTLSFFLDAAVDCGLDFHDTTVMVSMNSKVTFNHGTSSLSLDLHRLPWPIFLSRGKLTEPVTVVLPTSPSAEVLQAGLTVMGAFGRMTNGKMAISTITADQLTEELQKQAHLIFVGKPADFPKLADLNYPVPLTKGEFSLPEMKKDDGIVQILPSPWNSSRVVLLVSGNTDSAVVKASQALSTSNLETGKSKDYSVIADINPFPSTGMANSNSILGKSPDIKFSDLGYDFVTVTGIGTQWITYVFTIPSGQVPSEDVTLTLNISTSALIDPLRSEGIVLLNDVQVGSVSLSSDTSNLITTKIVLPVSAIKAGRNVLDLVFNMLPKDECSLFNFASMWITVYPDSSLHAPLTQAITVSGSFTLQDLKAYPSPFVNDPSLGTTVFVLSQKDPNSWTEAGKIAYDLGKRVSNPVLGFRAAFDGQVPDDLKANNMIIVGEPKNLGILAGLQAAMPAYFEKGSNVAVLETLQVVYRISPEKDLGYLQLFISPWNDQAAIMGVFGTTPTGLGYAVTSLLSSVSRDILAGNFITLDGSQALIVDTRTGVGIGRINSDMGSTVTQTDIPIPTAAPNASIPATFENNKQYIFIGILIVLVLIAVIAVVALSLRKKSS
jgi:cellulose synthase operon protein B